MNLVKANLHENIINSFSQPLEIILKKNYVESEVSTSNSTLQEVYDNCLEEGENPSSEFSTILGNNLEEI